MNARYMVSFIYRPQKYGSMNRKCNIQNSLKKILQPEALSHTVLQPATYSCLGLACGSRNTETYQFRSCMCQPYES